jgi:two-component system sensor histidine kinase MprB
VAVRVAALSLRVRVAVLVALVVGGTAVAISAATFFTIRAQYYRDFDDNLYERARALAASPALSFNSDQGLLFARTFATQGTRIALVLPDGTVRFAGVGYAPPLSRDDLEEVAVAKNVLASYLRTVGDGHGHTYHVVAVQAQYRPSDEAGVGPTTVALVLGQPLDQTEGSLRSLGAALLVIGAAGVLLAAYIGVLVARSSVRPVRDLAQAAEHVAETGDLRPIENSRTDELGRLVTSFNLMLAAVERSRDHQRRLVADAGHELRTPMTSMRTNLDLLLQAEALGGLSDQDRADVLADLSAQTDELTGLIGDLVELARDNAEDADDAPVDLAATVRAAIERARRRAGPGIEFDVRLRPWTVFGDARALERAVLNLLDNAVKWSPPNGAVTVRLSDGTLSVADEGPGIAAEDLPFIFDRFYRSEESRTLPGSGLGLAIVQQTALRHGGSVTPNRAPQGGALMKLSLPHSSTRTVR